VSRETKQYLSAEDRFGATLASLLDRRDRQEAAEGANFGTDRLFKGLAETILKELPPASSVREVDPAAGLFTRVLLTESDLSSVTALEPAFAFLPYLHDIDDERLTVVKGFTEDLPSSLRFDTALISFTSRRGRGLLALINELLPRVRGTIFLLLPDDGSLDWAYVLRAAAFEGLNIDARFLVDRPVLQKLSTDGAQDGSELLQVKRAVVLRIRAGASSDPSALVGVHPAIWDLTTRTIEVPCPVPRGAATRLVRYFMSGSDRAVLIKTDPDGIARLYGNLRTAAHRLARDEVTVRRTKEGVQLLLIPSIRS
jgi:hypothetical protein